MAPKAQTHSSLIVLILSLQLLIITSSSKPDSEILVNFKNSLGNNGALSDWNSSKPPCSGNSPNWVGVLCERGAVLGLQLENMGLSGVIDIDTLVELSSLRTISLMNNSFEGPLPNIRRLGALRSVFLSDNKFSGEIEGNAFDGMLSLKKVVLADNEFTGLIPLSLTIVPRLMELRLEGNQFGGLIPDFRQDGLKIVNVSNNVLDGSIPAGLSKMDASSFSGNKDLCGPPLGPCSSSPKLSVPTIIILVIAVVFALAAIVAAVFFILRRRARKPEQNDQSTPSTTIIHTHHNKVASLDVDQMEQGSQHSSTSSKRSGGEGGTKISFLRDDRERFDLPDLLKASAEILGSGIFGSSYRAALLSGPVMVVKRFRHMNNVSREEFQEHMRRLGRLRHPNLLPLVAFYYRREEKLLISDYVDNVSLAVYLHGNHSRGVPSLNWPARLKIIKGVARGLLYLHNELPSLIAPHGHLKSSNVLLNESFEPLLTDYGLVPIVNQEHAQELMVAYMSPEHKLHGRITKKTDSWSLGILILEILTGKFPANHLKGSETDLATWVHSIARDEGTFEMFDKEMGPTKSGEGMMVRLLRIGLGCCEADLEKRCDLKEAVERIEELKEKDSDEEFYSSIASDQGDHVHSSRRLSGEISFSTNG